MALTINTNVLSLNAQRNLQLSAGGLSTALERLASGLRINSARDDAAGLAISERFTAQIRGLSQAIRNTNDGISLSQTAEGALVQVTKNLQRIRELAVQSANDTNSATDRASLQQEVQQLQAEIDRIALQTAFNDRKLLDGTFAGATFQVGANSGETISFTIGSSRVTSIGSYQVANSGGGGFINDAIAATATIVGVNNNVAAQTLTVSGTLGTTTVAVTAGQTARTIAANVNTATSSTGVTASARTTATLASLSATGTVTFDLYGSNSTAATISATVASTSDLTALSDAINAKAGVTGISATVSGGTVTLTSVEGYDIAVENFTHSTALSTVAFQGASGTAETLTTGLATDSSRTGGTVTFKGSESFSVTTSATGSLFSAATNSGVLSAVGSISIGSVTGSSSALDVVDGALQFVNSLRARLGAVTNRFEATVANQSNVVEKLSDSRSRILDADFAAETAALTRAQILQQAGVAILAQANAVPQNVLALLR